MMSVLKFSSFFMGAYAVVLALVAGWTFGLGVSFLDAKMAVAGFELGLVALFAYGTRRFMLWLDGQMTKFFEEKNNGTF